MSSVFCTAVSSLYIIIGSFNSNKTYVERRKGVEFFSLTERVYDCSWSRRESWITFLYFNAEVSSVLKVFETLWWLQMNLFTFPSQKTLHFVSIYSIATSTKRPQSTGFSRYNEFVSFVAVDWRKRQKEPRLLRESSRFSGVQRDCGILPRNRCPEPRSFPRLRSQWRFRLNETRRRRCCDHRGNTQRWWANRGIQSQQLPFRSAEVLARHDFPGDT